MTALLARLRGIPGPWLVELFAALNLGFLAVDIYLAHSFNRFAHAAEWVPLVFSALAPLVLVPGLITGRLASGFARWAGLAVGGLAIVVGVAGLILHLESAFMMEQTLRNLVYTAPLAAPLAYTGVGLLLVLGRMLGRGAGSEDATRDWARWVLLLAAGGFVGNFALALADHAQNGFFFFTEWIPVIASALAVGFLLPAVVGTLSRAYIRLCYGVLLVQVAVGVAGAVLHLRASLAGVHDDMWNNLVYGAPVFAPLLCADLAVLAALGLRHLTPADREPAG